MANLFSFLVLLRLAACNAITAAPEFRGQLLRRQSSSNSALDQSCGPWLNLDNSCASANPSFTLLAAFASQGECLCYSSSTWAPDVYDSALATCLSYLSTASPAEYTSLDGPDLPRTPCLEVASIIGPGAAGGGLITSSIDLNYAACISWESISSTCAAATPGFGELPQASENSCLCYTSGTYAPSIFDNYWDSCLTYFSTASPSLYSASLGGDGGVRSPCAINPPSTAAGTGMTTATSGASASSGAGISITSAPSTSVPLTTTVATTAASGSGAEGLGDRSKLSGLLCALVLVVFVQL